MLAPLNSVAASMYLSEVRQLVDSLLFRIEKLEAARNEWSKHSSLADAQIAAPTDQFSYDAFNQALSAAVGQHTLMFDEIEALFAAWARLSLMFHPIPSRLAEYKRWQAERGKALRELLELPDDSLLADREFRDAWMHFDERLDRAFLDGWLGNRQQFVRSSGVAGAVKVSVRVIDIEGLAFRYRSRDGTKQSVEMSEMKELLTSMNQKLASGELGFRLMRRFPSS